MLALCNEFDFVNSNCLLCFLRRRKLSVANTRLILKTSEQALGNTFFVNNDIVMAKSFDPFTHIYMFDVGFPPELHCQIAKLFNESIYAEWLISYQPPRNVINEYNFKVCLENKFNTSMHGKLIQIFKNDD